MRRFGNVASGLVAVVFIVFASANLNAKSDRQVKIDGSSTVEPISSAIAEEFAKVDKGSRPPVVGTSGTGGGFKKFISKEIDIVGASRPVLDEEKVKLKSAGVEYVELKVGIDGLAIVVKKGSPVKELTLAELKKLWEPESKVKLWSDLRGKGHPAGALPEKPAKLYGPGPDSGTFDYFTEKVLQTKKKARTDYVASEDDNTLVTGVAREDSALGYFGFAYYKQHEKTLSLVGITTDALEKGKTVSKTIVPSEDNIKSGEYPLSRPLFIYVNIESLKDENVRKFAQYYVDNVAGLIQSVGYFEIPKAESEVQKRILTEAIATATTAAKIGKK